MWYVSIEKLIPKCNITKVKIWLDCSIRVYQSIYYCTLSWHLSLGLVMALGKSLKNKLAKLYAPTYQLCFQAQSQIPYIFFTFWCQHCLLHVRCSRSPRSHWLVEWNVCKLTLVLIYCWYQLGGCMINLAMYILKSI